MNQLAVHVGKIATGEIEDTPPTDPIAVARGKARASSLSKARRKAIAKNAANTRWKNR